MFVDKKVVDGIMFRNRVIILLNKWLKKLFFLVFNNEDFLGEELLDFIEIRNIIVYFGDGYN